MMIEFTDDFDDWYEGYWRLLRICWIGNLMSKILWKGTILMEVMYYFVIFLYSFKNASILLIIIDCAISDGSVSRNEHELSLTCIVILMI